MSAELDPDLSARIRLAHGIEPSAPINDRFADYVASTSFSISLSIDSTDHMLYAVIPDDEWGISLEDPAVIEFLRAVVSPGEGQQ